MKNPLAIYIHWPFCLSKCPYCDFNSHVRERVEHEQWKNALLAELAFYAEQMPDHRITSIFFGGGTPSLMQPATVQALLEAVAKYWEVAEEIEITLEANPTSSEVEKFRSFRQAGINRVSLGVQALDDEILHFLGRTHSASHALNAVEMAASVFPRYSFDLIYARPNQSLAQWEQELTHALQYAGDHLSLYQLTIEPGTAFFHAHARGDLKEIGEDDAAALYELTDNIMNARNMPAYEVSNYAKQGGESRHNLAYWRYQDYIGIGPGAHGRITQNENRYATQNIRSPEKWILQVESQQHGRESMLLLDETEQMHERLLMGLRLRDGIPLAPVAPIINTQAVKQLVDTDFLINDAHRLCVTAKGRLCLNSILERLVRD